MPLGGSNPVGLNTVAEVVRLGGLDGLNMNPLDATIPLIQRWRFIGCFVQKLGGISFDVATGDPITCDVTMGFAGLDDTILGSFFQSPF